MFVSSYSRVGMIQAHTYFMKVRRTHALRKPPWIRLPSKEGNAQMAHRFETGAS